MHVYQITYFSKIRVQNFSDKTFFEFEENNAGPDIQSGKQKNVRDITWIDKKSEILDIDWVK